MDFSKKDMNIIKGVAILMMLLLHLFCRKDFDGLYKPSLFIGDIPVIYYIGLFGDACVPIFCFASGFGLYKNYTENFSLFNSRNKIRLLKLMVNFWIILLCFIAIGYFVNPNLYPKSLTDFVLNMFLLSNSYNGAWWFLQTYVLLVLFSPLLNKIIMKKNSVIIFLMVLLIYFLAYFQKTKTALDFNDFLIIKGIVNALVLLGTSLLPFVAGALFAKNGIYSKVYSFMNRIKYKNIISLFTILFLIVFHGIFETMFIAPFTAITFISLFNVIDKGKGILYTLNFFGNHSTNIWLTHMFFYMILFPKLTFAPVYPILIFCWLIILCLVSSYLINVPYKAIIKVMDKRFLSKEVNHAA